MSELPKRRSCELCLYWQLTNGVSDGECHRHAPIVVMSAPAHNVLKGQWPMTRKDDWCGEFQREIKPKPNREPQTTKVS